MALSKVQKDVDDWVQQYKVPYWQPLEQMAHLTEEIGELAREINHRFGPKKKKSSEDVKEIGDEMGDMIFTLCCIANALNIDLSQAWNKVMERRYGRDNERYEKKQI